MKKVFAAALALVVFNAAMFAQTTPAKPKEAPKKEQAQVKPTDKNTKAANPAPVAKDAKKPATTTGQTNATAATAKSGHSKTAKEKKKHS